MGDQSKNQSVLSGTNYADTVRDDSFDAELDLLETTLTDLKDDRLKSDININENNNIEEISCTLGISDKTISINTFENKMSSLNSNFSVYYPTGIDEENEYISSTTQHKSIDSSSKIIFSNESDLNAVCKQNSTCLTNYVSCKENNLNYYPDCNESNKGHNVVISQCDSSFEESKDTCFEKINVTEGNMNLTMEQNNLSATTDKEEHLNKKSLNNCDSGTLNELIFESGISGKSHLNANEIDIQSSSENNLTNEVPYTCKIDSKENIDLIIPKENVVKNELLEEKVMGDVKVNNDEDVTVNENKSGIIETAHINIPNIVKEECLEHMSISKSSPKDNVNIDKKLSDATETAHVQSVVHTDVSILPESVNLVDTVNQYESNGKSTVEVCNVIELEVNLEDQTYPEKSSIYCSTPVTSKVRTDKNSVDSSLNNDFAQISPLNIIPNLKNKMNLKRKNVNLESIQEIDEDGSDIIIEKKLKLKANSEENLDANINNSENFTSTIPRFEPPAKSILKKWQPSCLSRTSASTSYIVLDECGESDVEENTKPGEDFRDPPMADDFELAYKSLTEELLKSSSNLETLEKYHSQVQMECQMDDEKFDEVLLELTQNCEWDDKTSLTVKTMDESVLTAADITILHKSKEDSLVVGTENMKDETLKSNSSTLGNTTVIEVKCLSENSDISSVESKAIKKSDNLSSLEVLVKVQGDDKPETSNTTEDEVPNCGKEESVGTSHQKKLPIPSADSKDLTMDEEDFLLEEDVNAKKKPYEFFEFVSSDPKENEDNYNPEWQKLGRLTTDEERYKAVRDRWRSLVPPDPNRDLTCRQWRSRNKKPPLDLSSLNNNHGMDFENEKNQLCTAVFDMKIKRMVQELEDRRMKIARQRNMDFEQLALQQDQEQRLMILRGGTQRDVMMLHTQCIEECRILKNRHDEEIRRITKTVEDKVESLKQASNEVMMFQQFYKGVGDNGDKVCLYLTDLQVQELMETEDMLEQYTQFYK